jgi:hypothetical protein
MAMRLPGLRGLRPISGSRQRSGPSISGTPDAATIGTAYTWAPTTSGLTAPLTFALLAGTAPSGTTFSATTGGFPGTPTTAQTRSGISIQVTDSAVPANVLSLTGLSIVVSAAFVLTNAPGASATVGAAYSYTPSTTGGRASYTWAVTNLPSWASFSTSTGALTGTPSGAETDSGIVITGTDADGRTVTTGSFTITVTSGAALSISGTPVTTAQRGVAYTGFSVSGSGGTAPYTYSVASGALPPGVTLNASTGAVSGTPTGAGVYPSIVLRVTDNVAATADLAGFSITCTYVGLLAATAGPNTTLTGGNKSIRAVSVYVANDDITDIKLGYENFRILTSSALELGNAVAATIAASVEYPLGTFNRIKFSAADNGNMNAVPGTGAVTPVTDDGTILSDQLAVSIPAGASFRIWSYYNSSSGIMYRGTQDTSACTASISGTVMTVTAVGAAPLRVGQFLTGTGVTAGNYITSFGTGTGGTGTYNISISNTLGSRTITMQGDQMSVSATQGTTGDANDPTGGGQTITSAGTFHYGPAVIVGTTKKGSAYLNGDSRCWGKNATLRRDCRIGEIASCIAAGFPFYNAASPASSATNWLTQCVGRKNWFPYCSDAIMQHGINDMVEPSPGGKTAAQTITSQQAIAAAFPTGVRCWLTTPSPDSTSSNAWADVAGQTAKGNYLSQVVAATTGYSTRARAIGTTPISGFTGYLEISWAVESAHDSGLWQVPPTSTADGVHALDAGYALYSPFAASAFVTALTLPVS